MIGALVRRFRLWAPVAIPVLVVLVVLDSGFWNGYAGHPLGLTILGAYLVLPRRQQLTWWAVLAFSVFSFFTQGFYYVCFALVVGCLALARRRLAAPILGALPSVGLALWYAAANTVNPGSGQLKIEGLTQFIAYKGYTLAKLGGYQNLQINTVGDARPLVLVGVGVNLVMVGLLLLLALVATVRRVAGPDLVPLRCAGWALTGLAAVLPASLFEVVNPGERLLGPALMLLALTCLTRSTSGALIRHFRWILAGSAAAGLSLTIASGLLLPVKASRGDTAPQDGEVVLSGNPDDRESVLLGHRLDQFEARVSATDHLWSNSAAPDRPPAFKTWVLLPWGDSSLRS